MADITGTKLFDFGEGLSSADVNQYLMRGVKVFADAAARDAAYDGAGEPDLEEGEVVYLVSTKETLVYNGTSWVGVGDLNAVGLWKIGGATFTTVAGFTLPDNSFSSTYENYRLIIRLTAVSADADLTGRMRASGTNETGSNYDHMLVGFTNGAGASNVGLGNQTSFLLGESDTVFVEYRLIMDIVAPQIAVFTSVYPSMSFVNKAADNRIARQGACVHKQAVAYDSFAFISTQNISGEYWLYGYRNN